MQRRSYLACLLIPGLVVYLSACKTNKHISSGAQTITLDTFNVEGNISEPVYRASSARHFDLVHTELDLRFNWPEQLVYGKAKLRLTPHFYPQDTLILDAKGFDIHTIQLLDNAHTQDLRWEYDSLQVHIALPNKTMAGDTLVIQMNYTAMPGKHKSTGSAAITDDRGLYFINPEGKKDGKHMEIWSQGETESNSCWFPTIDKPNQKSTEEIYLTVRDTFKTLSNGELVFSTENGDGTRTDYWRMMKPHAPYLFMIAVGDFAIVNDQWTKFPLHYYVEPKWAPYAKDIFRETPNMLTFFGKILGVPYPWPSFNQIIVRDYVSGAMENTTAVVFGAFVYKTKEELIDGDEDDIIAHEMFHHWFGDLVTCESWSNLPLNESFATYAEYLWQEHKNGRDAADRILQKDLGTYLSEARIKRVNMIRFHYDDKEDMFDSHSYAKGGCILHMLRKAVGDSAFFKSLQYYLKQNAYQSVEIGNLRLAFEHVTGKDMHWFFDQWFLASGHPDIDITYQWNDTTHMQTVTIDQNQDFSTTPDYRLPLAIDVYESGAVRRYRHVFKGKESHFTFPCRVKPDLVNVDAEKMLLCEKHDAKTPAEWAFQYRHAPLYLDRYEALIRCGVLSRKDSVAATVVIEGLADPFHELRKLAIQQSKHVAKRFPKQTKQKLYNLGVNDPSSSVRGMAIDKFVSLYGQDQAVSELLQTAILDSSYLVKGKAIDGLAKVNREAAFEAAKKLEHLDNASILSKIAGLYAVADNPDFNAFYINNYSRVEGFYRMSFIRSYSDFLKKTESPENTMSGLALFKDVALNGGVYYIKLNAYNLISDLSKFYGRKIHALTNKASDADVASEQTILLQNQIAQLETVRKALDQCLSEIRHEEDDPRLIKIYGEAN